MISKKAALARFALASCVVLASCGHAANAPEPQPVPVKVRTVERTKGGGATRYSGSLEAAAQVNMAFRVGGYVDAFGEVATPSGKRAIDKGDFVKKGTMLARVRAADYAQKAAVANAQVVEARAQSKLADEELVRAKKLFEGKVISRAELDAKIAQADAAKAQVEGAVARSGEAGLSLADTVLRAPMDGVVLSRQIELATLVAPGQPAITVADTRTVKAVFGAPQTLVEKLHVGSAVQVFVGAESEAKAPEKLLDAKVTRIAPAADTNGRVFSVEAALPNPRGELRPGSVVSVRVPDEAVIGESLIVPLAAVVRSPRDPRGFAVFVLDGEGDRAPARLRDVRLGEVMGNSVTVTKGLRLNQRVVTAGSTLLRDGGEAVVIR
jgi:RND family efflux transporter MFP subunit